jgi:phytoene synthase
VLRPDPVLLEARATTRRVARTFALACRLLPRDVRDDVYRLYLVFRTLDDLVDDGDPGADARIAAVEAWASGAPGASPEGALLEDLARRHVLPRDALREFCRGMRMDLDGVPMQTEGQLDDYCFCVAGTVGVTLAAVLGVRGDPAAARRDAAALGAAMQRTNVLRDVDEDLARGRVYLPAETLARLGASPAPGDRGDVLREEIARADALYAQGLAGIRRLRRGRLAIRAAALMYQEILREIERDGYGAQPGRATVAGPRKAVLVGRAALRA